MDKNNGDSLEESDTEIIEDKQVSYWSIIKNFTYSFYGPFYGLLTLFGWFFLLYLNVIAWYLILIYFMQKNQLFTNSLVYHYLKNLNTIDLLNLSIVICIMYVVGGVGRLMLYGTQLTMDHEGNYTSIKIGRHEFDIDGIEQIICYYLVVDSDKLIQEMYIKLRSEPGKLRKVPIQKNNRDASSLTATLTSVASNIPIEYRQAESDHINDFSH